MDKRHRPWPKIHNWYNMVRDLKLSSRDGYKPPILTYRAKIKLHGTNASVTVFPDGGVVAQSRNRILTPGNDNYGFASWVHTNSARFSALAKHMGLADDGDGCLTMTLYGEWIGNGIQNGVSACRLDKRVFALFSARFEYGDRSEGDDLLTPAVYRSDSTLSTTVVVLALPDVVTIPWHAIGDKSSWEVDLSDESSVEAFLAMLESEVESIDKLDPFVSAMWGIDGPGEGLVLYPMRLDGTVRTDAMFKVKGPSHRIAPAVTKDGKQGVPREPRRAPARKQRAMTLAGQLCTTARIEQGFQEACTSDGAPNPVRHPLRHMDALMAWLAADIQAECMAEIEDAGLQWARDLSRPCGTLALEWLKQKFNV